MPRSRPSRKSWASNPFRPVGRRALRGSPFEIERPRESRAPGAVCVFAGVGGLVPLACLRAFPGSFACLRGQGVWCCLPVCVCAPGAACLFACVPGAVCVCAPGAVCVFAGVGGSGAACLFACLPVCGGRVLTPRESGGSSPPVSPPAGSRQRPLPPACGSTPAARRGSPAR